MHKSDIDEIKKRYDIDLGSIDFDSMDLPQRLAWGQKMAELEKRLIIDNFYETLNSPAFNSTRAYSVK